MIAYHLDRSNSLCEGQELKLFELNSNNIGHRQLILRGFSHVSRFGLSIADNISVAFSCPESLNICTINSYQLDISAEELRIKFFEHALSRFTSVFAFRTLSNIKQWSSVFNISHQSNVFEIEYDPTTSIELDAFYLRGNTLNFANLDTAYELLYKYYAGYVSDTPQMELLIPCPTKVGKRIDISELIT